MPLELRNLSDLLQFKKTIKAYFTSEPSDNLFNDRNPVFLTGIINTHASLAGQFNLVHLVTISFYLSAQNTA